MSHIIEKQLSERVLTIGECYWDTVYGGIASVLKSYCGCFETFKFVPSSRKHNWKDKFRYDLGGLFIMGWRLLWDREIKIVHIHTAAGGSFDKHAYYAFLAHLMGKNVVMHCHASRFKVWYEALTKAHQARVLRALLRLDCLIVLSESWRSFFVSIGMVPDKIRVLNNITSYPEGNRVERISGEAVRLLFLGEIGSRKGVFDLLEAMSIIHSRFPGIAYLEIGGNKMEKELRDAIHSLSLDDCVRFNGFVSGEDKNKLLRNTDVFVLPSYNEGLPISILEAMSYGCAIISTPVGGIPEVVKDNGVLVNPGDAKGIADAILLLSDPDTCRRMGRLSQEAVKAFYPDAVMSDLKQIYNSLLTS